YPRCLFHLAKSYRYYSATSLLCIQPYACADASFLTLITGAIPFSWRNLKFALESYAPSPSSLLTFALEDACSTIGTSISPSLTSSFVTSIDSIFPVLTSTARWTLMKGRFTIHTCLIQSP